MTQYVIPSVGTYRVETGDPGYYKIFLGDLLVVQTNAPESAIVQDAVERLNAEARELAARRDALYEVARRLKPEPAPSPLEQFKVKTAEPDWVGAIQKGFTEGELRAAAQELVEMYVANRGTKHEFISCITPKHAADFKHPEMRSNDKTWVAWDRLRRALGEIVP